MVRYSKEDVLNIDERKQLVESCKSVKERFIIILLMFTGMRANEAAHLKQSWIDYQRQIIHVPSDAHFSPKTKASVREIPIDSYELRKTLLDYFSEKHGVGLHRCSIFRIVKRVASRIRPFKKVYPHSLRATRASMLAEAGVSAPSIQRIMGWSKLQTAENYIRSTRAIEETMDKMGEYYKKVE